MPAFRFDSLPQYDQNILVQRARLAVGPIIESLGILASTTIYLDGGGDFHRTDGPAIDTTFGQQWWTFGSLHRTTGPAYILLADTGDHNLWSNYHYFYLHGLRFNPIDFWSMTENKSQIDIAMAVLRRSCLVRSNRNYGTSPRSIYFHIRKTLQHSGMNDKDTDKLMKTATLVSGLI